MKTIIHDLSKEDIINYNFEKDYRIIDSNKCFNSCIGCFSCLIMHPKKCFFEDEYSNLVESLKKSDELIIISKARYGCLSSSVKRVLERCISYLLPYFIERDNMIHLLSRYDKRLIIKSYFYGEVNEIEKKNIESLIKANCININALDYKVYYLN